jgi:O-antigen/teichoic acid export membrane protein
LLAPVVIEVVFGGEYRPAVLPFQILIWMIPVAWFSGHFRFSLIVSGHQRLEFTASAIAGAATAVLAVLGSRAFGAPGAAAALLIGGIVNAVAAGVLMHRFVGGVRLTTAAPALTTCAASVATGLLSSALIGRVGGAALACSLYAAITASQWDFARLKRAWEGRT